MSNKSNNTLVCDKCGAENWNLASEGLSHDQHANDVKGYGDCDGIWRFPRDLQSTGVVIEFPKRTEKKTMTQGELLIAGILASVATGKRTVAQLRRQIEDGMAYVERIGVKNVERSLLNALAATESAIARIEAERVKYDRLKNN